MHVLRDNRWLVEEQNLVLEEKVTERTLQLQERSQQLELEKKKSDDLLLKVTSKNGLFPACNFRLIF
jgi:hypothetical protein